MTCDRYWREGALLFEQGEPDPHRSTCLDCSRDHEGHLQIVGALPKVGATAPSDPRWQARVWRQIAREQPRRWGWSSWLSAAIASGATAVVALFVFGRAPATTEGSAIAPATHLASATSLPPAPPSVPTDERRPRIEIVAGAVAMRSTSAHVGDRVRISVGPNDEVRVYRASELVLRCPGGPAKDCRRDAEGVLADTLLVTAGDYRLVVISGPTVEPVGSYDHDFSAILKAGGEFTPTDLKVR